MFLISISDQQCRIKKPLKTDKVGKIPVNFITLKN